MILAGKCGGVKCNVFVKGGLSFVMWFRAKLFIVFIIACFCDNIMSLSGRHQNQAACSATSCFPSFSTHISLKKAINPFPFWVKSIISTLFHRFPPHHLEPASKFSFASKK